MPDKKNIIIETVHGVKTRVFLDWPIKRKEESEKNVKEGVDKDDNVQYNRTVEANHLILKVKTMGMEVIVGRGIILSSEEALSLINDDNRAAIIEAVMSHREMVREENKEWYEGDLPDVLKPLSNLSSSFSVGDLRETLMSCVQVNGEVDRKYAECHIEDSEMVSELFRTVFEASGHDLPSFEYVEAFGCGRHNGWDVPFGVPCFAFSDDDCYRKVLTKKGKSLQDLVGHCRSTTWTWLSYQEI